MSVLSKRGETQQSFPHSTRVKPAESSNPVYEFCQQGGRRILILYASLAFLLFMRSYRGGSAALSTVAASSSEAGVRAELKCKTIHFIRHGEATHNRDAKLYEDFYKGRHLLPVYNDAALTDAGHAQAAGLFKVLSTHKKEIASSELIVSSTLRRALQTARAAFPVPRKIISTDLCRERLALYASDKRRSLTEIAKEFPHIEFAEVDGELDEAFDKNKEMLPSPYDSDECKARARKFVDWLVKDRPEQNIVVVTHWVFLSHLLRAEGVKDDRIFDNAELRSITLCRNS